MSILSKLSKLHGMTPFLLPQAVIVVMPKMMCRMNSMRAVSRFDKRPSLSLQPVASWWRGLAALLSQCVSFFLSDVGRCAIGQDPAVSTDLNSENLKPGKKIGAPVLILVSMNSRGHPLWMIHRNQH
eukprot:1140173-Pelagomonas_calceolata.AAC.1